MSDDVRQPRRVGRYALYDVIASGGMGAVHFGRLLGPVGFSRTVAVKCLHAHMARDPEFVAMFLDEARLAARIVHPNVVPTLDVVAENEELFVVMEYVQGESLAALARASTIRKERISPRIAAAVMANVLHGLHAAHETKNERGEPLGIVHRDVSPQNILVGIDGVARLLDFGVARAADRLQTTREGRIKGKLAYMAPEMIRGQDAHRQADVYAAGVVLWEALCGQRLFKAENEGAIVERILFGTVDPPTKLVPELPPAIDDVVMRALAAERTDRFSTAREMAIALQNAMSLAAPNEVGEWVEALAEEALANRAKTVRDLQVVSNDPDGGMTQHARALVSAVAKRAAADSDGALNKGNERPTVSPEPTSKPAPGEGGAVSSANELSSITSSSSVDAPIVKPRGNGRLVAAAGGLAMVLVAAGLAVATCRPTAPPTLAAPIVTTPPVASSSMPITDVPPPASAAPSDTSSQVDAAAPVTTGSAKDHRSKPPPIKKKDDCNPPWTLSPAGVRVYKRGCL